MKHIISYELFSCATPAELDQYINEKIRAGWQPYGFMQAITYNDGNIDKVLFTQAVVKYED